MYTLMLVQLALQSQPSAVKPFSMPSMTARAALVTAVLGDCSIATAAPPETCLCRSLGSSGITTSVPLLAISSTAPATSPSSSS
jgi:hypothetical protein